MRFNRLLVHVQEIPQIAMKYKKQFYSIGKLLLMLISAHGLIFGGSSRMSMIAIAQKTLSRCVS